MPDCSSAFMFANRPSLPVFEEWLTFEPFWPMISSNMMRSSWVQVVIGGLLFGAGCLADDGADPGVDLIEGPPAGADLIVTSVNAPPATALVGSSFTAGETVENAGGATADASTTRYYLSFDGVNITGAVHLGQRSVPSLAPGGTNSGTGTATIPEGTVQGTYFVLACADRPHVVTESNESNNCTSSSTSMVVSAPDLVVTSVSVPPGPFNTSQTLTITDTVANSSTTMAGASTTRYWFSTDQTKSADDGFVRNCTEGGVTPGRNVPALAGSETNTDNAVVPLCVRDGAGLHPIDTGSYYVIACADELKTVPESIETNNCTASTATFMVTRCGNGITETGETCDDGNTMSGDGCSATCTSEGTADLVETSVSNPPATANLNTSFSVTDTAQNNGTNAGASTTRYYLSLDTNRSGGDPQLTGQRAVPSLAMGASSTGTTTVTVAASTPAGTYFLLACADAASVIVEASETNNCMASATTVSIGGPDLITSQMSNPPTSAAIGSSFTVTDRVANIGTVNAGQTTTRYFLSLNGVQIVGASHIGQRTTTPIPAGGSDAGNATVTIPAGTAAGSYFIIACADRLNVISENNENNNCTASATTVMIAAPDLVETAVSVTPTVPAGGTITVTETVTNSTASNAGASITRFFLSTDNVKSSNDGYMWSSSPSGTLSQRSVPAIPGSGSSTGVTTMPLFVVDSMGHHAIAPGTYFIIACADVTQLVGEVNETNNCTASTASFTVTP
jgi:cysteine-rich repeat protein